MAVVTASTRLNIPPNGSISDWADPEVTATFFDNIDFTSAQGNIYQDLVRSTWAGDLIYRNQWLGSGLQWDAVNGALTAGTINAFVEQNLVGGSWVQGFAVEGFALDAVLLSDALNSTSTADDMEVVRAVFAGADTFNLSNGNDNVSGFAGNDTINGSGGNDVLRGDAGRDMLNGGTGVDTMSGGAGGDTYIVDSAGDVTIETSTLAGEIDAVRSAVSRVLGDNLERLTLTGSNDISGTGNGLANLIAGNPGRNILGGGGANDTLLGGAGNDTLLGGLGNDSLAGGLGNDSLNGGAGIDTMAGGAGNDVYVVDVAGDVTTETSALPTEIDTVQSAVTRTLGANLERLTLTGIGNVNGSGNTLANLITGNAGANALAGGAGNDTLSGGLGNDTLAGGAGLDAYLFATRPNTALNADRISGFVAADDRIQLDDAAFSGVGAVGALAAAAFRVGTGAGDADDRIVYNPATGQLWFDADGTGAVAAVQFASVAAGTVITAADFFIV